MASSTPAATYQAVKLLTAVQFGKIQSGVVKLPAGVTIVNVVANAGATMFTVTFQGKGLGSFAQFQAIPCSMTVGTGNLADTLKFAASGIYHGASC